jgi:16S rRNA (guanine966-N2)-methyltransferase
VREAVFNALWSRGALDGARAVDLFAGSGALGIEALSRGAAHVTFVDSDRAARRAIERNLAACGVADRATVVGTPVERWLAGLAAGSRFDLAFCDPPYAYDGWVAAARRVGPRPRGPLRGDVGRVRHAVRPRWYPVSRRVRATVTA